MRNWILLLPVVFVTTTACRDEPATAPHQTAPAPKPDAPSEAPTPRVDVTSSRVIDAKRVEILKDPAFRDVTFQSALVEPFVVFQEVNEQDVRDTIAEYDERDRAMKKRLVDGTTKPTSDEQHIRWAEKADSLAERSAVLLAELDRRFRELFAERFHLPTLEEKGRRPTVVSLWNERRYMRAFHAPPRPRGVRGLRGHYDARTHEVVTYLGDEFLMSKDELLCADGRVQKAGDQWLLTDGAEQLLGEYAAIHRGRPLVDDKAEDASPAPKWFVMGLSAWLGAFEVPLDRLEAPAGADVLHERIRLDCVAESRGDREMAEKWTLNQLMKPLYSADQTVIGEKLAPGGGGRMTSFFECRAWAFCHFLWNYDGGKYREQITDFLGCFLDGTASSHKFAHEIMKRPSISDWGDFEMEYEWYWTKLLERKVGQTKITHTWATPTTTPPEGTVENDEEFLAWWKDAHAK